VEQVLREIAETVGDPARETTRGRYTTTGARGVEGLGPMRDFRPHHWPKTPRVQAGTEGIADPCAKCMRRKTHRTTAVSEKAAAKVRLRQALGELPEIEVGIDEIG
jgi:hypothetical protein